MLGDRSGHRSDRTKARDRHALAGQVDYLRRMHGVTESIEECADAEWHVGPELDHIRSGESDELRKRAVLVQAVDFRPDADVAVAAAALQAFATDNVHLRRDV